MIYQNHLNQAHQFWRQGKKCNEISFKIVRLGGTTLDTRLIEKINLSGKTMEESLQIIIKISMLYCSC